MGLNRNRQPHENPPSRSIGPRTAASIILIALVAFTATAAVPTHAGTLTTLYSFTDGADGGQPVGGVVIDSKGTLYGETYFGGTTNCTSKYMPQKYGCGTVYSYNSAAGLKPLVTFTGSNGAYGLSPLTINGPTLYGSTNSGGVSDDGVIFSVNTDGTGFTLLHQFTGRDGKNPTGALRIGTGNVLYGQTASGGLNNDGVLFALKPDGTYSILHNFAGGSDGRDPQTLLISSTGVLVGSTEEGGAAYQVCSFGCGTVFEYDPSSQKYANLYSFNGTSGVGGYISGIGPGQVVYGNDGFAPFSLSLSSGLVNVGAFSAVNARGNVGSGPFLDPNGSLIGVNGDGSVFAGVLYSAANGAVTDLAFFGTNGGNPLAEPILLPSGLIIGTASLDGLCKSCGTIWEYTP